jgi:succinyl-CoA synthetase beta subunit
VILSNDAVTAVLFNIFGGITRCDEVARGLIEAFRQIEPSVPFVVRLDGTNDKEGRALLAEADLPNVHTESTMLDAARRVVELAGGGSDGRVEGTTVPVGEGRESELGAADARRQAGAE